jgi:hypothetical protein
MKKLIYFLLFFISVVLVSGCKKDDDSTPGPGSTSNEKVTLSITGIILDVNGQPIQGATVMAGNKSGISNSHGIYVLENAEVDKARCVISASKVNFVLQQKAIIPEPGIQSYANLYLFADDQSFVFNSVAGATMTLNGNSQIVFPPNAFVTETGMNYSGTVKVSGYQIDTDDPDFSDLIPGGDLLAENMNGARSLLTSYGMAGAEIYDNTGNKLKIAPGKSALIRFQIATAQQASAPSSIMLWHYDEIAMLWKEEGAAVRNGNYYEGNVNHFSWWNCDIPSEYAYLSMNVVNCIGAPAMNYIIRIIDNTTGMSASGNTNNNGNCIGIVPANNLLNVEIRTGYSQPIVYQGTIGPFISNTVNSHVIQIPNVNCTGVGGQLLDCIGNPVAGTVVLMQNNIAVGIQSNTLGVYGFTNLAAGTYQLLASSGFINSTVTQVIPSGAGQVITTNLFLCDTNQFTPDVTMFILDTLIGNITYQIDVTHAEVVQLPNMVKIIMQYTDSNIGGSVLEFLVPQYAPGSYNWNSTDCTIQGMYSNNASPYNFETIPSNGVTVLTSTPGIGNNITGSFNGVMQLLGWTTDPVQLNASFNVRRDL